MLKEERVRARQMRTEGQSIIKIAKNLKCAKSTIYEWTKDIPVDPNIKKQWRKRTDEKRRQKKQKYLNEIGYKDVKTDKTKNYNPKLIGDISEVQIIAQFVSAGKIVCIPFGENQRYDLIVDEDGKLYRIQCKTAQYHGTKLVFPTCSVSHKKVRKGYRGQVELFAVYFKDKNQVFLICPEKCATGYMTLQLKSFGSNGKQTLAKDYLFTPDKKLVNFVGATGRD